MTISSYIDHTLLRTDLNRLDIEKLCNEAIINKFKAICIPPSWVKVAKDILRNENVLICTVIGFPHGNQTSQTKVFETKNAIANGADEVDMVVNLSYVKSNLFEEIQKEISDIREASVNHCLKVIFETSELTDNEIIKLCKICTQVKVNFVKTSTGFASSGASVHAVDLMKNNIGTDIKIKASGGIRDLETAKTYIDLGVSRLGTSSGVAILNGLKSNESY